MKLCKKCQIKKPFSEFYKHNPSKDGLRYICKTCHSLNAKQKRKNLTQEQREHVKFIQTQWARNNPQKVREQILRRKYKLTLQKYDEILLNQKNGCAICGKPDLFLRSFHVDHDHSCCSSDVTCGNCIRGILCNNCNNGLGKFKDDSNLLYKAIEYLNKSVN